MNVIIHKITYHVINNKEDVQALLDSDTITKEVADLWLKNLDYENLHNCNLTLEVRDGGGKK